MIKLSEIKGEAALEMTADLLEPIEEILTNGVTAAYISEGKHSKMAIVAHLLRHCKKPVIKILAILNGKSPEEYESEMNVASLPAALLAVLNDKELMALFNQQF